MYDLGDDIISIILNFINLKDAIELRAVSKSFRELVTNLHGMTLTPVSIMLNYGESVFH